MKGLLQARIRINIERYVKELGVFLAPQDLRIT